MLMKEFITLAIFQYALLPSFHFFSFHSSTPSCLSRCFRFSPFFHCFHRYWRMRLRIHSIKRSMYFLMALLAKYPTHPLRMLLSSLMTVPMFTPRLRFVTIRIRSSSFFSFFSWGVVIPSFPLSPLVLKVNPRKVEPTALLASVFSMFTFSFSFLSR